MGPTTRTTRNMHPITGPTYTTRQDPLGTSPMTMADGLASMSTTIVPARRGQASIQRGLPGWDLGREVTTCSVTDSGVYMMRKSARLLVLLVLLHIVELLAQ